MPTWSYKYIFPGDLSLTTTKYQEILARQKVTSKSPPVSPALEVQVMIKAKLFVYKEKFSNSPSTVSKS
jgi:hypothetical protein